MADPALRSTALTEQHRTAGARMAPFAGWEMPVEFTGTLAEHAAVRDDVGVFDVSHLGTVFVSGQDAAATIGRAFTCDTDQVAVGASQYTLCCTLAGGVIDDLIVYHLEPERWMVVPNAANTPAVLERLAEVAAGDVTIVDESGDQAIMAVQGPRGLQVASEVLGIDVAGVAYLGLQEVTNGPAAGGVVVRTGYTGEPGCEVVVPNSGAVDLWSSLVDAGAQPCGLGARDTLRLEMGYPLHGNELSVHITPYEARLGWAVKLDHDFVGRDALVEIREAGPRRRLWGLRVDGRRPLREGMAVRHDGIEVGQLTSGGFSPTLQVGIGLALLDDPIGPEDAVVVDVRGRDVDAVVVRPPFVDRDPRGA
jgi:aminomethyltransferase